MDSALSLANALDGVTRWIGRKAGWLMLPLIFVIMFDVVTRKLDYTRLIFSEWGVQSGVSVSTILQDAEWHFHGALLLLSFGFGYLANAHVRVDVFRELLPRRRQAWLELVALLVMATPFLAVMLWYSTLLFDLSFEQWEGSDSLTGIGWRWAIKFFMPLGFVFACFAVIATVIRLLAFLFGDETQRRRATEGLEVFSDDHAALDEARRAAEAALAAERERERSHGHKHGGGH